MSKQYYCLIDGQEQGPYSGEAVKALIANGAIGGALIKDESLIWRTLKEMGFEAGTEMATPTPLPKPSPAVDIYGFPISSPVSVTAMGSGRFLFTGPYGEVFLLVERAMADCGVSIKERSSEKGIILGKCKYGLNPFGMTVSGTFHSTSRTTELEVAASFTDAVDTFGACKKKVSQVSERLQQLASTGVSPIGGSTTDAHNRGAAPSYAHRVGPSHKGKAVTGFLLGLGSLLLFLPAGIAAILLSGSALFGISASNNKSGKGFAISGLVIGILCIVIWVAASLFSVANPLESIGAPSAKSQASTQLFPSEPKMTEAEIQQCRSLIEIHIRIAQEQARYLGEERAIQQALQRIEERASDQCRQYAATHFQ